MDQISESIAFKFDVGKTLLVEYPDSEELLLETIFSMVSEEPGLAYFYPIITWDYARKFQVVLYNPGFGIDFRQPEEHELPGWAKFRQGWEMTKGPINVVGALDYLTSEFRAGGLFVFLDTTPYINDPNDVGVAVRRLIKYLTNKCKTSGGDPIKVKDPTTGKETERDARMRAMFVSSTGADLHPELQQVMDRVEYKLPDADAILREIMQQNIALQPVVDVKLPTDITQAIDPVWKVLAQAALGLSLREVGDTYREGVISYGTVNESTVRLLYQRKIDNAKRMGLTVPNAAKNDVGGLEVLREWAELRRPFFFEHSDFSPKGIVLVGPPGTGKSQCAKVLAMDLKLPLFLLQADAIFDSLLGESEKRFRQILEMAEANAPCILWIDEIERLFSESATSDVSSKVIGMYLTWMQEQIGVFNIATSNDLSTVPPQMLRRFDERFLVDLPGRAAREQILKIHLGRYATDLTPNRARSIAQEVAKLTEEWSGAELELLVKDSVMLHRMKHQTLATNLESIISLLEDREPLARQEPDRIQYMRDNASRFKPASKETVLTDAAGGSVGTRTVATPSLSGRRSGG